jgi:hypothetical protein
VKPPSITGSARCNLFRKCADYWREGKSAGRHWAILHGGRMARGGRWFSWLTFRSPICARSAKCAGLIRPWIRPSSWPRPWRRGAIARTYGDDAGFEAAARAARDRVMSCDLPLATDRQ